VTGALIYLNLLRISPDAAFSINWTRNVRSRSTPFDP
jgi:hypothetical protein